jgi:FkbM family methyltransferase
MLERNVAHRDNISVSNVALSPSGATQGRLVAGHAGDGEAMLAEYRDATFNAEYAAEDLAVDLLHPAGLPRADVIKLDVEGAEADILEAIDLDGTSLVVLEFQTDANRDRIVRLMEGRFSLIRQDAHLWDRLLLGERPYNATLQGDHWGHLAFFATDPSCARLRRDPPSISSPQLAPRRPLATRLKRFLFG